MGRSTEEDVPPGAATPSGTLHRGRCTTGGRDPKWWIWTPGPPRSPQTPQDAPGGPRKPQEAPGRPRTPQDAPGRPRTPQEAPGRPRTPQDAWGPKPRFWVPAQICPRA